ncbi:MAG: TIGR04552 family protein [Nannocystaceae bacterium]|nr:TIGR04552 family protein [bacterium]
MTGGPSSGDDALGVSRGALRTLIAGRSALDNPRLNLVSRADAGEFLAAYGFDLRDPTQRKELQAIRKEAMSFLEEELLPPGAAVPEAVRKMLDVRTLLVWASHTDGSLRQRWACAVLRVMHTCAHAHSFTDLAFGGQVRAAVEARLGPHVTIDEGRTTLGRGADAIPLVRVEFRQPKTLSSVVVKLLAAAENVATEIYDRQGLRFVTRGRLDAFLVVHYLRVHHIVMLANVMPSRCRNTLLDPDWYDAQMARIGPAANSLTRAELVSWLGRLADRHVPTHVASDHNRFSNESFRSIQFTCREMLRLPARDGFPGGRFFFPYEVQILDAKSDAAAREGDASHAAYRERQREAARRRVLGDLV